MRKNTVVYPGSRVITSAGTVRTVALVVGETVYAFAPNGWLEKVVVRGDAYGGEHDQMLGLVA